MSLNITDPNADTCRAIEQAVKGALDDAEVEAKGGGGHFEIRVKSQAFDGKNTLQKQRLVLKAIKPLMEGDDAPVHAVDKLETLVP